MLGPKLRDVFQNRHRVYVGMRMSRCFRSPHKQDIQLEFGRGPNGQVDVVHQVPTPMEHTSYRPQMYTWLIQARHLLASKAMGTERPNSFENLSYEAKSIEPNARA